MPETIAFYGAGLLGSAFVRRLCGLGLRVRVWNRTFSKAQALERFGAHAVPDPAQAAQGAARVHLCLRSDDAVDETLERAVDGIAAGTPTIDHTTVLPSRIAGRIERLASRDVPFLHAPVFMGPPNAAAASGLMLASGSPEVFASVREPLQTMCGALWYLGARVDKAAIFKLMGNAMILSIVGGLADMFAIATANGLSRREAYTLFERYDPGGQITGRGKRMAAGDYEPTWTLEMAHKDANLMLASANELPLPVIDALERALRAAIDNDLGEKDLAALAER